MILYMYIAPEQGLTTPWDEILMSAGTSCHFGHFVASFKKISLKSDFIHFFSSWFNTYIYSSGAGADSPQDEKV